MPNWIWALKNQIYLTVIIIIFSIQIWAKQEITVFDVRKTFPLTEGEEVYKDFYINGGSELGLRPGMVITVKRRVTLYDVFQNKSPGDVFVSVGKLKLIQVQNGVSVAREHEMISRENSPVLDYDFIMVGDKLDLDTITMDRGKVQKSKRKSASIDMVPVELPMAQMKSDEEPSTPIMKEGVSSEALAPPPQAVPVNSVSM